MTRRKLAIPLAWQNFSEYHSEQLARAIIDEWDTTITYDTLNWDEFDLVMPFFPHRKIDCDKRKVIRILWERHEFGFGAEAGTVIAPSLAVWDSLQASSHRFPRLIYLPWGINTEHFSPRPLPLCPPLIVGWCGLPILERKQYVELKEVVESVPGVEFRPNPTRTDSGRTHGPYEMQGMGQYYAQIHVYACASSWEGFGFPLLEASACGRPVVTFDVGCARDLALSGAGIVLVSSFVAMQEAIPEIDYEVRGKESRDTVEKHWSWGVMAPRWMEMLEEAYEYSRG